MAREAGYTRGTLHHQFANKEDLALAVVRWVEETWHAEVDHLLTTQADRPRRCCRSRAATPVGADQGAPADA